ncbi:RNA-directed DNA polymerase (reverse transcriptase) and Integrase domain containing [Brachionus plicatilis]|uniref:RNA-directed DNA polymerase (Reverse transcriptase) and Integrase domain containing n=1 Tax=Brachionus plicatilis TaxID=10195 RepID=A0A3M7SL09_BRAPC|nr:RNA-directed DNA polymerase (reverse transcriptase) and Integrase domain containing [Brachionus plicatilis]
MDVLPKFPFFRYQNRQDVSNILPPIKQKMRRVPHCKREEFKKMLDEMLEAGLIQKSDSHWASPFLLVTKPH